MVTPVAKPLILRGLERVSPATGRRRFFTARYRLSDEGLEAMTKLDGPQRFALGAAVRARCARMPASSNGSMRTQK